MGKIQINELTLQIILQGPASLSLSPGATTPIGGCILQPSSGL